MRDSRNKVPGAKFVRAGFEQWRPATVDPVRTEKSRLKGPDAKDDRGGRYETKIHTHDCADSLFQSHRFEAISRFKRSKWLQKSGGMKFELVKTLKGTYRSTHNKLVD